MALVVAVVVASLLQVDAQGMALFGQALPDLCPYHALGHACPGCGTTRAGVLLLQGQVAASLRMQPALPLFLLAALLGIGKTSLPRRRLAYALAAAGLALATWHLIASVH